MTAESIRIERDALLTRIVASTASATRALKTMIRDLRRSQWFLLVAVVGGAVIALVAIKVIALLAAAFDISFLRDVGNNVGSGGAAGGAAAGAGGAAGGGGNPPGPPPWWKQPAGPPAPDGSPPHRIRPGSGDRTPNPLAIWFSQTVQNVAGTRDTTTKANAISVDHGNFHPLGPPGPAPGPGPGY